VTGVAHFRNAGAADRPEARIHDAVLVGLDNDIYVLSVLLNDLLWWCGGDCLLPTLAAELAGGGGVGKS
jgi:hypothetical protein